MFVGTRGVGTKGQAALSGGVSFYREEKTNFPNGRLYTYMLYTFERVVLSIYFWRNKNVLNANIAKEERTSARKSVCV